MTKLLKKYGKRLASLAVLSVILSIPLVVGASGLTEHLDTVAGQAGLQQTDIWSIIGAALSVILSILGVLLVLLILYAGFLWMTSAGDKDKVTKAKQMIYQAVIGLLIIFAAYSLTSFVITTLSDVSSGTSG